MFKNLSRWEKFLRIKSILELIAIIFASGALFLLPFQIESFSNTENNNSVLLMQGIERDLNTLSFNEIFKSIHNDTPILVKNGGNFSPQEIEDFLDTYEGLGTYYNKKLVSIDLICDWFGAEFASIFANREIKSFIAEEQKEDSKYYERFVSLEKALQKINCFQ
jgi:hypothetical protein